MKLSGILNFSIALLLALNIIVLFSFVRQYNNEYYYSDEVVSDASDVLQLSNISVKDEMLREKSVSIPLYQCESFEEITDYYYTTSGRLFGSDNTYSIYMTKNGYKITSEQSSYSVEFYENSDRIIITDNSESVALPIILSEDTVFEQISEAVDYIEMTDAVKKLFENYGKYTFEPDDIYYNSPGDVYKITYSQYLDGIELPLNEFDVYFRNDKIIYLDGNPFLYLSKKVYYTDLNDNMKAVFQEKSYFSKSGEADIERRIKSIDDVYYSYYVSCTESYFLIPAVKLNYAGDYYHIRSLIGDYICAE